MGNLVVVYFMLIALVSAQERSHIGSATNQAVPFYLISVPGTQFVKPPAPFVPFQSPVNVDAFSVTPEKVNELDKSQQWRRSLQQPLSIHSDSEDSKATAPTSHVSHSFSLPTYSVPFTLNSVSLPFYRPVPNPGFPIGYGPHNSANIPTTFIPQRFNIPEEKPFLLSQLNDQNKPFIYGLSPPKNSQLQNYASQTSDASFLSQIQQPATTIAPPATTVPQPEEPSTLTIQKVENNGLLESTLEVSEAILNQNPSRISNNTHNYHSKSVNIPKQRRNQKKNLKRRKRLPLHSIQSINKGNANLANEEANTHFDINSISGSSPVSNVETLAVENIYNEPIIPKIIDFNMIRGYGRVNRQDFNQLHHMNAGQELSRSTYKGTENLNEKRQGISDSGIYPYKTTNIESYQSKQNALNKQHVTVLNYLSTIRQPAITPILTKGSILKEQEDGTPQTNVFKSPFLLPNSVISSPPTDVIQQNAILYPHVKASSFANQQQGLSSIPQRYLLVEQPITSNTEQSVSQVFLGPDGRLFALPKQETKNKVDTSEPAKVSKEATTIEQSENNTNADTETRTSLLEKTGPARTVSETFTKEGGYLIRTRVEEYVAKDLPEEFRNHSHNVQNDNNTSNKEFDHIKEDESTRKDIIPANKPSEEILTTNVILTTVSPVTAENFLTETVAEEKTDTPVLLTTTVLTSSETPLVSSLPLVNISSTKDTTTQQPADFKASSSYDNRLPSDHPQVPSFLQSSFVPNHIVVKPVLLPNGQIQFVIPNVPAETSSHLYRNFPDHIIL